jgi:hypothetical protein
VVLINSNELVKVTFFAVNQLLVRLWLVVDIHTVFVALIAEWPFVDHGAAQSGHLAHAYHSAGRLSGDNWDRSQNRQLSGNREDNEIDGSHVRGRLSP